MQKSHAFGRLQNCFNCIICIVSTVTASKSVTVLADSVFTLGMSPHRLWTLVIYCYHAYALSYIRDLVISKRDFESAQTNKSSKFRSRLSINPDARGVLVLLLLLYYYFYGFGIYIEWK